MIINEKSLQRAVGLYLILNNNYSILYVYICTWAQSDITQTL